MKEREIGGYLELDRFNGSIYHESAIALNSGRSALRYLIRAKSIKKIYLPYFCCNSVTDSCKKENIEFEYYHINKNFRPIFNKKLGKEEWFYIVNLYGQISNNELETEKVKKTYERVIIDNAQAYFQLPVAGIDTIYTCRKFLGVSDGAFLYTDKRIDGLERDNSSNRMKHVLGRLEETANEYFADYKKNEELISKLPIQRMSKLTENILRRIDYNVIEQQRSENFIYLHEKLKHRNKINLKIPTGAYMYPFYCDNGDVIKKKLQARKIYIPTLWPEVSDTCELGSVEYDYAMNILPLPVDQRYTFEDMQYIIKNLMETMEEN